MAKGRIVTCRNCGKKINLVNGAWRNNMTHRYMCNSCYRKMKADARLQKSGMRQSIPAMIAKIVFGLFFIIGGVGILDNSETSMPMLLLGFIILGWGIIPAIHARRKRR